MLFRSVSQSRYGMMIEICEAVRDHQRVAIKAGNSVSKSYTMARVAPWFLYTHYPATVVTTAPSAVQVEEILWREIATAHANAKVPLGGQVMKAALDLQKVYKERNGLRLALPQDQILLQNKQQGFKDSITRTF